MAKVDADEKHDKFDCIKIKRRPQQQRVVVNFRRGAFSRARGACFNAVMEASGSRGAYGGGGVGDDHGYDWHSHESAAPHSHGGGGHDHGGVPCGGHGHDHGMGGEEFDAEQRHWNDVLRAFREYSRWMEYELRRRDAHLAKLPPRLAAMLPPWSAAKGTAVRGAVAKNQQLLTMIAEAQADSGFGADGFAADEEKEKGGAGTAADVDASSAPSAASASVAPAAAAASAAPLPVVTSSAAHFSKVKSTLHQLVRDWSDEGKTERDACYAPVMAELKARLPVTAANRNQQRVCIPGCGTGRFVFDCALEGYAAQGCEFSVRREWQAAAALRDTCGGCGTDRVGCVVASSHTTCSLLLPVTAVFHAVRVARHPQLHGGAPLVHDPPVGA